MTDWRADKHPSHYGVNFNPHEHPDELMTVDGHTMRNGTILGQYLDVDDNSQSSRLWIAGVNSGVYGDTPTFQEIPAQNCINVQSMGADPTGVVASGAIINKAIAEAIARGYGRVYIPAGQYLIEESIVLDSLIWLHGDGYSTYLRAKTNLNAPMIETFYTPLTRFGYMQRISDMRLDGNRDNQSDATNAHGVYFQGPTGEQTPVLELELAGYPYEVSENYDGQWFDANRTMFNMFISYCAGDGFRAIGRSGTHIHNVTCQENQGFGFWPNYDTSLVNCTAGRNGKAGFYITNSAIHLTNCKAWWSGYRVPDGYDIIYSHGFYFFDNSRGSIAVNCEAQDNWSSGFAFEKAYGHACYNCVSDSNNQRHGSSVGVDFWDSYGNTFTGIVYDRYRGNVRDQVSALRMRQNSTMNRVDIQHRHYGNSVDAAKQAILHISTDSEMSSIEGNEININNLRGTQRITGTSASPSVFHGGTVFWSLTGTTSVSYESSGAIIPPGTKFKFVFLQDGTGGRVVNWNASNYLVNWTPDTTANKINTIEFTYNNTIGKWVQSAVATGI